MRNLFVAPTVAVMLGMVAGFTPLIARDASGRLSSDKPRANIARHVRPQPQPETPPIGYCLKCLPPPYEWPRGGAGPS